MSPLTAEDGVPSGKLARMSAPKFEVIIMIVFLKSTFLPCESVKNPTKLMRNAINSEDTMSKK
jgi:hypothetical protein